LQAIASGANDVSVAAHDIAITVFHSDIEGVCRRELEKSNKLLEKAVDVQCGALLTELNPEFSDIKRRALQHMTFVGALFSRESPFPPVDGNSIAFLFTFESLQTLIEEDLLAAGVVERNRALLRIECACRLFTEIGPVAFTKGGDSSCFLDKFLPQLEALKLLNTLADESSPMSSGEEE
jgi:hypothetical protein